MSAVQNIPNKIITEKCQSQHNDSILLKVQRDERNIESLLLSVVLLLEGTTADETNHLGGCFSYEFGPYEGPVVNT